MFLTLPMDAHCETGAELIHVLSSVNNSNNVLISQGRGAQGVRGERPQLER